MDHAQEFQLSMMLQHWREEEVARVILTILIFGTEMGLESERRWLIDALSFGLP
jgi:hypothetical protein